MLTSATVNAAALVMFNAPAPLTEMAFTTEVPAPASVTAPEPLALTSAIVNAAAPVMLNAPAPLTLLGGGLSMPLYHTYI